MTAHICDAIGTPRPKARSNGGLAKVPPQALIRQSADGIDARVGSTSHAETLVLGGVGQIGAQGGNIALLSKLQAGLPDPAAAWTLKAFAEPDSPCGDMDWIEFMTLAVIIVKFLRDPRGRSGAGQC